MLEDKKYIDETLKSLPHSPGVYKFLNKENTIIYVGKAKNLNKRIHSYFNKQLQNNKTRQLVNSIKDIQYIVVNNEQDAFLLENNLIKTYKPHYNIQLKDDKTYPSICITKETYPRIYKTRKLIHNLGIYYGPYSFGNSIDLIINIIHELYPIRTCSLQIDNNTIKKSKHRVCLKYHLGKCCGICEGKLKKEEYDKWIQLSKKIIQGDISEIENNLKQEIDLLKDNLEYEKAQIVKQKYELLQKFCSKTIISNISIEDLDAFGYNELDNSILISILHIHNGSIRQAHTIEYIKHLNETKEYMLACGIKELREQLNSKTKELLVPFIPDIFDENLHYNIAIIGEKKRILELAQKNVEQFRADKIKQSDKLNPEQKITRILKELQQTLNLDKLPVFIESYDNSNLLGTNAVAGCIVFRKGKPSKKEYKRFEIKTVKGIDDYASMREIVKRRYQHIIDEKGEFPDLIIADGGIGQMNAIREVIEEQLNLKIPIVGLKKDNHHKTHTLLYGNPPMEINIPITSNVFRLMTTIQEEVHRFAISYHKNKRLKKLIQSQIDDLEGVGEKNKQKILLHFGSFANAKSANLEEWQKLLGNKRGSNVYIQLNRNLSL